MKNTNNREIEIGEMPQGCFLTKEDKTILVSSPDDAVEIILSLIKMLRIQYTERFKEFQAKIMIELVDFGL